MKKLLLIAAVIAVALISFLNGNNADVITQFKVVKVIDGDSLIISVNGQHKAIELAYIDTPELDQAYGLEAKAWLQQQINDADLLIEIKPVLGSYKIIAVADKINLNRSLVTIGYAWLDREDKKIPNHYVSDFNRVQAMQKHIWSLPEYKRIEPWIWREDSLL